MKRSEVVAAKRELRRLRAEHDRLWFRNANGFDEDDRDPDYRKLKRIEAGIAELEAKLLREGATWR